MGAEVLATPPSASALGSGLPVSPDLTGSPACPLVPVPATLPSTPALYKNSSSPPLPWPLSPFSEDDILPPSLGQEATAQGPVLTFRSRCTGARGLLGRCPLRSRPASAGLVISGVFGQGQASWGPSSQTQSTSCDALFPGNSFRRWGQRRRGQPSPVFHSLTPRIKGLPPQGDSVWTGALAAGRLQPFPGTGVSC